MKLNLFYKYTPIKKWEHLIEHRDAILLIGSCFAQALGHYLGKYKFDCLLNPFGTLYNPLSISKNISASCQKSPALSNQMYVENKGVWKHFDMHGDIYASSRERMQKRAGQAYNNCYKQIKKAKWIVITYGSAYVYQHKEHLEYVANCHKMPSSLFHHKMLSPTEIENAFQTMHTPVNKLNQGIHYVLSVSPVRYPSLGLENNSQGKARLIYAIEKIVSQYDNVHYFPSYELMVDELRDYRFYEEDRIHPNQEAKKYIWNRFNEIALSTKTKNTLEDISTILQAVHHRVLHPESSAAKTFFREQLTRIQQIAAAYPYLDFKKEMQHFHTLLKSKL